MVFEEIIKKVDSVLEEQKDITLEDSVFLGNNEKNKKTNKIKKENFRILNKNFDSLLDENNNQINNQIKIFFIDGGNQTLIDTKNFNVSFFRIGNLSYILKFENNQKPSIKPNNIFDIKQRIIFTQQKSNLERGNFDYEIEDLEFKENKEDSEKERIKFKIQQDDLKQDTPNIILANSLYRRLLELKEVLELSKKNKNSLIVLDGSLQPKTEYEKNILKEIIEINKENKNYIIGVSKTNSLMTRHSKMVSSLMKYLAPKSKKWVYNNLIEDDLMITNFIKLHEKSKHVFMSEFLKSEEINEEKINELYYILSFISGDPIFLGYPYGLVKIDEFVRVTNEEKNYFTLKMRSNIKNKEVLENLESNSDAHGILDSAKFDKND